MQVAERHRGGLVGQVSEYLSHALGADASYSGLLTHNPVSRKRGFKTKWMVRALAKGGTVSLPLFRLQFPY